MDLVTTVGGDVFAKTIFDLCTACFQNRFERRHFLFGDQRSKRSAEMCLPKLFFDLCTADFKKRFERRRFSFGDKRKRVSPDRSIYDGMWEYDLPHGKGVRTFADGRTWEGTWERGQMVGYGTFSMDLKKSKVPKLPLI